MDPSWEGIQEDDEQFSDSSSEMTEPHDDNPEDYQTTFKQITMSGDPRDAEEIAQFKAEIAKHDAERVAGPAPGGLNPEAAAFVPKSAAPGGLNPKAAVFVPKAAAAAPAAPPPPIAVPPQVSGITPDMIEAGKAAQGKKRRH